MCECHKQLCILSVIYVWLYLRYRIMFEIYDPLSKWKCHNKLLLWVFLEQWTSITKVKCIKHPKFKEGARGTMWDLHSKLCTYYLVNSSPSSCTRLNYLSKLPFGTWIKPIKTSLSSPNETQSLQQWWFFVKIMNAVTLCFLLFIFNFWVCDKKCHTRQHNVLFSIHAFIRFEIEEHVKTCILIWRLIKAIKTSSAS